MEESLRLEIAIPATGVNVRNPLPLKPGEKSFDNYVYPGDMFVYTDASKLLPTIEISFVLFEAKTG